MHKRLAIVVTLVLLFTMILPISIVKAQSNNTNVDDNDLTTKLTITYPNDNTFYVNTMPLVFTIDWNSDVAVPWMNMQISYSIDDNQKIQTNGGGYLVFSSPVLTTNTNSDSMPEPKVASLAGKDACVSSIGGFRRKISASSNGREPERGRFWTFGHAALSTCTASAGAESALCRNRAWLGGAARPE